MAEKKNFLQKFVAWVKGFNLIKWFKGFVNGDETEAEKLKEIVETSNDFVAKVLAWLKNPAGDILTAVIPGEWDDNLKKKATELLEKIAYNGAQFTGCVQLPTVGEQLACVYNKIIELNDEDEEDSFKHKLGVLATKVFANGKLDFGDAVIAAQFVFELVTKKKK